ncbi:MAG: 16S rRNA (cytosine(967)-C(5))-methyltransferase [Coleofasciculaceae cyanobacterium SM2_1_6]|nr:16S rRNA (cytosine(967)-C(5))-methyltransferase [Coleofasciculaceae cyanobacterium SM2_1_6]
MAHARQIAFNVLKLIGRQHLFTDVALDQQLRQGELTSVDRRLVTELVYGCVRRQRSLDFIIDQLAQKPAHKQPPDLRLILHLGLYQLRYLEQIPDSAAVNTTVQMAKDQGLQGLASFVNGLLRQYLRTGVEFPQAQTIEGLGVAESFPDWIVELWLGNYGETATAELCHWFNQAPSLDLRINPLKTSIDKVITAFAGVGITATPIPHLPQGLRIKGSTGSITQLPGFTAGWWTIQDASAQLVSHFLDPQPGEVIIDACAAPGGKTTHIAELMQDQGTIWGCDRPKRLSQLQQNCARLQLQSIQIQPGDSRDFPEFIGTADRVLVDAPCSGLGTLHRHPDIRWRQNLDRITKLNQTQQEILASAATWVRPGGELVYATCTLHPLENQLVIKDFLTQHPQWQIVVPALGSIAAPFANEAGWIEILPHQQDMDGFFMVKLKS